MKNELGTQSGGGVSCRDGLGSVKLEDGSEILEDYPTETTRYVLYRHGKTGNLNMAIHQGDNVVSVRTHNLRFLLAELVAKHEPPNEKLCVSAPTADVERKKDFEL